MTQATLWFAMIAMFATLALVGVVSAATTACSDFSETPTSDAAGDASSSSSQDAPSTGDVTTNDAGSADADAAFCANAPKPYSLCVDFDQGQPAAEGFQLVDGDGGVIDKVLFVSPPASVVFNDVGIATGFESTKPATQISYELRYKMRLGDADGKVPPDLASMDALPVSLRADTCAVELFLTNNGRLYISSTLEDAAVQSAVIPLQRRPIPGQWAEFRLFIQFASDGVSPPTMTFEKDGLPAIDPQPLLCPFKGDIRLAVGMFYGPGVEVRFDDILLIQK